MTRLLVVSEYSRHVASARARVYQYLPLLEEEGIRVDLHYVTTRLQDSGLLSTRFRRVFLALVGAFRASRYDALLVHRLFPRPLVLSALLGRFSKRLVLDYDDSYHVDPLGREAPPGQVERLQSMLRAADCTVVSNEYLRDYSARWAPSVVVIPTTVNVDAYPRRQHTPHNPVVVGWIGSGGAQEYLASLSGVFQRLHARYGAGVRLEIVTAAASGLTLDVPLTTTLLNWELEREHAYFERFDIGLMPLPDNRRSQGKASYKALEYMASQVPVVASPVGTNRDTIEHGTTGFLAGSDDEWVEALSRLIDDHRLRQRLGERGREMVQAHYSVERWYPSFRDALEGRARPAP